MTVKVNKKIDLTKPRDIYNRPQLLKRTFRNLDSLDNPDKADILKFVQHMNDNRNADLTVVGKVGRLITLREKLRISFRNATENDMRKLFDDIEKKGWKRKTKRKVETEYKQYSAAAVEKFRKIIKEFYRVVYGMGELPQQVKWIKTKSKKDNASKKLDFRKVLSHEQIIKLVEITKGLQRKSILGVGWELGARPEELLRLTNLDLRYEQDGIYCMLRGKTGEREIKVEEFEVLFKQWLENHPLKHEKIFSIWVSEATNRKNQPLGLRGAEKIAEEMIPKVDATKEPTLYTLRHSRATFLAKCGLNEPALRLYFGWDEKSDEPATYIHLSGRDLNAALAKIYGKQTAQEETKVILQYCPNCKEKISPGMGFCARCGKDISVPEAFKNNVRIENKNATSGIEGIKLELQKLHEADKQNELHNESRWSYLYSVLESVTGQKLNKKFAKSKGFGMASLLYKQEYPSKQLEQEDMEKIKKNQEEIETKIRTLNARFRNTGKPVPYVT